MGSCNINYNAEPTESQIVYEHRLYMICPQKESDTTLYCGANSLIGYYMFCFNDLLTGESYMSQELEIN